MGDCLTLYQKYWRPFGELLTEMENNGFRIDADYLRKCELTAHKECQEAKDTFLKWVYST